MKSGEVDERLFVMGMWWRITYGVARIFFGLAILKVVGMPLTDVLVAMMGHELHEDPTDLLYVVVNQLLEHHHFYVTYFLSFYFIFWGTVDVFLSISLLKHRLWAFPVAVVLISGFIVYSIGRFSFTHSLVLLFIICLDTLVVWLIWREWQKLKHRLAPATTLVDEQN